MLIELRDVLSLHAFRTCRKTRHALLGQFQGRTCARWSIEDDAFWRLDAHFFIIFWVSERQLHRLLTSTGNKMWNLKQQSYMMSDVQAGRQKTCLNLRSVLCLCQCGVLHLNLLDLVVQSSDVGVRFLRRLFHFHHRHQRIRVIHQYTDHSVNLQTRHETFSHESGGMDYRNVQTIEHTWI